MTQSRDSLWAFQYYLGRKPESEKIIHSHSNINDIGPFIFNSPEAKIKKSVTYQAGEFCVWKKDAPKIVVISSCQALDLSRAISAISDVSTFGFAIINTKNNNDAKTHYMRLLESADYILSANLSDQWHPFDKESLVEKFKEKVIFYHRPYYQSLHPDLTYANLPPSPIGDYHSKIIIDSYKKGLKLADCLKRFNRNTFEELEFHITKTESDKKLLSKDQEVDIQIADWIFGNIFDHPFLYTINHPMMNLQLYIAKEFMKRINIPFKDTEETLIPSTLSKNAIWPIYPEWADEIGLNYQSNESFWFNNYMMSREEFVMRSYEIYTRENVQKNRA